MTESFAECFWCKFFFGVIFWYKFFLLKNENNDLENLIARVMIESSYITDHVARLTEFITKELFV